MTKELPKDLQHLTPDEVRTGEITNPKAIEKFAERLEEAGNPRDVNIVKSFSNGFSHS